LRRYLRLSFRCWVITQAGFSFTKGALRHNRFTAVAKVWVS
jgi:hypothetical protein